MEMEEEGRERKGPPIRPCDEAGSIFHV